MSAAESWEELYPSFLGFGNLNVMLFSGQITGLGAFFFDDFDEDFLQVRRQFVEPALVDQVDEEALCIVDLGKVFGDGELLGDIADDRCVVETIDDASLQCLRDIRPRQNGKLVAPGFVEVGVDRGLSDAEVNALGICQIFYREWWWPSRTYRNR